VKPARVLIVGSSAAVRRRLAEALASDPGIELMGAVADWPVTARRIGDEVPDAIVLGTGGRHMDGLALLRQTMARRPIPVLVCSRLAGNGAESALKALELGAVGVIALPESGVGAFLRQSRHGLCLAAKAAAAAGPRPGRIEKPCLSGGAAAGAGRVVLVGASTGGPEALGVALKALPAGSPGLLIVQHMPAPLTAAFARHLDGQCAIAVKEAEDGDPVLPGRALLAPGNRHLLLRHSGGRYYAELRIGGPRCRYRPSVDVLFRSGARCAGPNAVGVLLTGMGSDGARGLLCLKQAGASTIVQDEATSAAFAMPRAAMKLGAAARMHPIGGIAPAILEACQ